MSMNFRHDTRGQAIAEMAVLASLILLVFAGVLSYLQRMSDQQYVEMDAFRRALETSNTYQGNDTDGAGASVQYTVLENRRHVDLTNGFRKGNNQAMSASSNVFWAIPKSGATAQSLVIYKINEDVVPFNYANLSNLSNSTNNESFRTDQLATLSNAVYSDSMEKFETPTGIVTTQTSRLQDSVSTVVPYSIVKKDPSNATNETVISTGELLNITQGVYVDANDGQYKYSQSAAGRVVERGKTWSTPF